MLEDRDMKKARLDLPRQFWEVRCENRVAFIMVGKAGKVTYVRWGEPCVGQNNLEPTKDYFNEIMKWLKGIRLSTCGQNQALGFIFSTIPENEYLKGEKKVAGNIVQWHICSSYISQPLKINRISSSLHCFPWFLYLFIYFTWCFLWVWRPLLG